MFEEASSIKDSKAKENSVGYGRATGAHGRAPEAKQAQRANTDARPCRIRYCGVLRFFGLYILLSFIFWETSKPSFGSTLWRNLGFSVVSINPIRRRLD